MSKTRLVHSFYTGHCSEEQLEALVWTYALSALYAHRSGFEIVLHTDELGAKILRHAPYDKIVCSIGEPPADGRLFAWPKFHAMASEPEGSIHIDGDVFLKKETLQDLLTFDDCDIIVQSVEKQGEPPYYAPWTNEMYAFRDVEYPQWMNRQLLKMYNCGVVGFKDKNTMHEYHSHYWHLIEQFCMKGRTVECVPDLVAEQQLLYEFARHKGLKVKTLLSPSVTKEEANTLGYQHLLGGSKYKNLDKTKAVMKSLDIDLFIKLKEKEDRV